MKILVMAVVGLVGSAQARAQSCPKVVEDAVTLEIPGAAIVTCSASREQGRVEYTVQISSFDHANRDLVVSPGGNILEIDEPVALPTVPSAVRKAFATTYPGAEPARVIKRTARDGVTYELDVSSGVRATFTERGDLVGVAR